MSHLQGIDGVKPKDLKDIFWLFFFVNIDMLLNCLISNNFITTYIDAFLIYVIIYRERVIHCTSLCVQNNAAQKG